MFFFTYCDHILYRVDKQFEIPNTWDLVVDCFVILYRYKFLLSLHTDTYTLSISNLKILSFLVIYYSFNFIILYLPFHIVTLTVSLKRSFNDLVKVHQRGSSSFVSLLTLDGKKE